ncbi:MAG: riboflavin kinase [bacterium]
MQTIKGIVVRGRGVGKQLGAPTANIKLNKNYQTPESGVFSGFISINKKKIQSRVFYWSAPHV